MPDNPLDRGLFSGMLGNSTRIESFGIIADTDSIFHRFLPILSLLIATPVALSCTSSSDFTPIPSFLSVHTNIAKTVVWIPVIRQTGIIRGAV